MTCHWAQVRVYNRYIWICPSCIHIRLLVFLVWWYEHYTFMDISSWILNWIIRSLHPAIALLRYINFLYYSCLSFFVMCFVHIPFQFFVVDIFVYSKVMTIITQCWLAYHYFKNSHSHNRYKSSFCYYLV